MKAGLRSWTLLTGCGCFLLALLWTEWTYLAEGAIALNEARSPVVDVPIKVNDASAIDLEITELLARPLFTRGRQPPREKPLVVPTREDLPRLTAILIYGADRNAMFVETEGGRPIVLSEGDRLGMAEIHAIRGGEVVLSIGKEMKVLKLMAKPRRPVGQAYAPTGSLNPLGLAR